MTIQECYKKMGADYQEVLGRLHNEAMICKFVRMFLQDDSFQILEEALRRGDVKEAFRGAHTLKGVCQNLGFSNLYAPTYTLTETLRAGQLEGTQDCKGGRAVQAHGGRYPRAGLKKCDAGRLLGCPALFFYRVRLKTAEPPLVLPRSLRYDRQKEGRRPYYVQTYPCLPAHQCRAESPH